MSFRLETEATKPTNVEFAKGNPPHICIDGSLMETRSVEILCEALYVNSLIGLGIVCCRTCWQIKQSRKIQFIDFSLTFPARRESGSKNHQFRHHNPSCHGRAFPPSTTFPRVERRKARNFNGKVGRGKSVLLRKESLQYIKPKTW